MKTIALALALMLCGSAAQAESNCSTSLRGCVHVDGYTTRSGSVVQPYERSYPRNDSLGTSRPSSNPYGMGGSGNPYGRGSSSGTLRW